MKEISEIINKIITDGGNVFELNEEITNIIKLKNSERSYVIFYKNGEMVTRHDVKCSYGKLKDNGLPF